MTKDLIERLEAATGSLTYVEAEPLARSMADAFGSRADYFSPCLRALQGSLDASLALVGEKLPGWMVAFAGPWRWADHTARGGQPIWCAEIDRCTEKNGLGYREVNDLEHRAPTPALAVLIALLKALETK